MSDHYFATRPAESSLSPPAPEQNSGVSFLQTRVWLQASLIWHQVHHIGARSGSESFFLCFYFDISILQAKKVSFPPCGYLTSLLSPIPILFPLGPNKSTFPVPLSWVFFVCKILHLFISPQRWMDDWPRTSVAHYLWKLLLSPSVVLVVLVYVTVIWSFQSDHVIDHKYWGTNHLWTVAGKY